MTRTADPSHSLPVLRWQSVPALPFFCSISALDPQVLRAAEPVFGPWRVEINVESEGEKRLHHWHIERDLVWQAREENATLKHESLPFLLAQIEYGALQKLVLHLEAEFFGLHGALLSRRGRAILLVGPKEAGKSTLSVALWQNGWQLHCDDFSLLDGAHHVHPTARRVSLRAGSRVLLGEELWQRILSAPATLPTDAGCLFHPPEVQPESAALAPKNGLELSAIFFLQRREAKTAPAQVEALCGARAALGLLPYSTFLMVPNAEPWAPSAMQSAWGAALPRLTALASQVPAFDLGRGGLDAMISAIERTL